MVDLPSTGQIESLNARGETSSYWALRRTRIYALLVGVPGTRIPKQRRARGTTLGYLLDLPIPKTLSMPVGATRIECAVERANSL